MIGLLGGLYVLATCDGLFSGICAASGRNGLIRKRRYYLRAMFQGIVWAQVACLVGLAMLAVATLSSENRHETIRLLQQIGWRMATVYAIYAAVVLLMFVVRTIPSVDIRSTTSTIAFGPLTLARPAVIVAGALWGLALSPPISIGLAIVAIVAMMIPFRVGLNWWFDKIEFAKSAQ